MSELNQTLLQFELEQNFAYDDYFVSKNNYFAFSLIGLGQNGKKIYLIFMEKNFQGKVICLKFLNVKIKLSLLKMMKLMKNF